MTGVDIARAAEFIAVWAFLGLSIAVSIALRLFILNLMLCAIGWSLFTLGMYIHHLSHAAHPKAHEDLDAIDYIADHGIYAWVRHPGYLGLMLMFFGIAIAFGSILAVGVAVILSIYHYILACKEERQMLKKFGEAYIKYMERVPDRFLPIRKVLRRR